MGTRMDELEQSIASLLVVQQQQQPKDRRVPVGIEATADVFGEIRPQAAASPLSRSLPPSTAAAPRGGTMALPKINNPNPKKNMVSISAAHPVIAKASSSLYARGNNTNNTLHAMARATAPHQQQHRKSSPNVIANNTTKSSSTGSSNIHLLETRNPPTTGTATTTLQSPSPSPSSSFAKQNSLTVAEFPRFATSIEI